MARPLVLWERTAGEVMNTNFVFGDIDYADGVIPLATQRATPDPPEL